MRFPSLGRASAGVASNGIGFAVTFLIQIASVPVYLKGFGSAIYGEWLVLSAIPLYLSLFDFGFSSVSSTQATREFAIGELARARSTLRSSWIAVTSISLILLACSAVALPLISMSLLPIDVINDSGARLILFLLIGYTLFIIQTSFVEGCFRAAGRFPFGIILVSVLRFLEFAAASCTALWSHNPVTTAVVLFSARALGQVTYVNILKRVVPGLALGYETPKLSALRSLATPGAAWLCFALGNTVSVQGMVLVTAATLGPKAVVTLNVVRMIANFLRQISGVVNNGVLPEVTAAMARGDRMRARRLVRKSLCITLLLASSCAFVLLIGGNRIIAAWTGGGVQVSTVLLGAMLATVLADLPWLAWSVPVIAQNRHQLLGFLYAGSCLCSLIVAKSLSYRIGLLAVPLSLFLMDIVLYLPTYRGANRAIGPLLRSSERTVVLNSRRERGPSDVKID